MKDRMRDGKREEAAKYDLKTLCGGDGASASTRFDVSGRRRPAPLPALHKDKMQPVFFFPHASWAASLSIFYEQQPNHRVGIIKHRLGYTTTEDVFWKRLISEERAPEQSSGTPERSETLRGI